MSAPDIAAVLTPWQRKVLIDCCDRGSTRANDGGLVDDLLSGLCSKSDEVITNGWLVRWDMNPESRTDGYISRYTPTPLGIAVRDVLLQGVG